MSRRTGLRDRWRDEAVIPHQEIGDACKVLLLVMATRMTDKGYFSGVSREQLADVLGVHPRRVAGRIDTAVKHGLLAKIGGGYIGRTAEYVATMPPQKGAARRHPWNSKGAGERHPLSVTLLHPDQGQEGDAERHTNTRVSYVTRKREPDCENRRGSPTTWRKIFSTNTTHGLVLLASPLELGAIA